MSVLTKFALPLMAALGFGGCDYPRNIREYPEPWKILDPGVPLEKFPKIEIVSQGTGNMIERGDLVHIHILHQAAAGQNQRDRGAWWLWMGFRSEKETSFFGYEPAAASAVLGLRQGTIFKFIEPKEGIGSGPQYAGKLHLNVFGDTEYYSWKKNTTDFVTLYVSDNAGDVTFEIKRVCKGQAQYRTVRLFDDSPVKVDTGGFKSYTSNEPRETWIDEARITAECQDGRKVTFQYGPIGSTTPGKKSRTPVMGYFDSWFNDAWRKIPKGVQFENNRPPVAPPTGQPTQFTTRLDTPIKIDILARASDPDGDHLTTRIVKSPGHGQLTANPDGSFTYSPEQGWIGSDDLSYKVSDGLVESELAWVHVYVAPDKK
ncbi:MAG: Ig-like domain-containing protein [Gallionella sp.]|jgi:hypothetical protein|nr:Ig-like domain-containing protein [Gallionella sp.]